MRIAGQTTDGRRLESGHHAPARRSCAVSRIDARVRVVDTEGVRTFTERFDATPIRIGRALDSDLVLPHPAIAARHGEIAIGARAAHFRSRAWLRASYVDGARVKRGRAVKLADETVISLGPYEIKVWFRVRDRRYERDRRVTPLVSTPILIVPEMRLARSTEPFRRVADPSHQNAAPGRRQRSAVAK
jgi:pSer/pThr/pTyr-binding forkhead associated (FHA) protein